MSSPELEKAKIEAEEMVRIARMPHYHYDCGWHDGVKCMYHMIQSILCDLSTHKARMNDDILEKVYTEVRHHYMDLVGELYQGAVFGDRDQSPFIRIDWTKSDAKKKKFVVEYFIPKTPERIIEAQQILLQELMKPKSDILVNRPQDKNNKGCL